MRLNCLIFYQQWRWVGWLYQAFSLATSTLKFKGWLELQRMTWSKLPRRIKARGGWRGEIHGVFWLFFSSVYVWSPPVNSQYFKRALMGWETCRTQRCLFQSINWASLNLPICISVNIPLVKNSRFCDYEENSHMPGVLGRNKRHMRIVYLLHSMIQIQASVELCISLHNSFGST